MMPDAANEKQREEQKRGSAGSRATSILQHSLLVGRSARRRMHGMHTQPMPSSSSGQ
jgi:hypothetical protein